MLLLMQGEQVKKVFCALIAILVLLTVTARGDRSFAAEDQQEENHKRTATTVVDYTEYEWWVIRWSDNAILCSVLIDHEGLPTGDEILEDCGVDVYDQWKVTPPCPQLTDGGDTSACLGLYLFQISSRPAQKTVMVELPPPVVWVSLSGCTPTFPANVCSQLPSLLLTGEEPLPNEQITAIHAIFNGQPVTCFASTCEIPLQPTPQQGITVEFWADSSFGDSSQHYTAQVRVIDTGVSATPGTQGWYVDVLSSQWRDGPLPACALTWQALPPIGGPPAWLSTPEIPELLASDVPYAFLAGRLIAQGVVDASECPSGGLLANGYADACGLEKALPAVEEWQNQFDARIIEVAKNTGVPAQLLKNLFAQESQFWPGAVNASDHIGLGHITDNGADVLLMWNPEFFAEFCPLVLDASACEPGYLRMDESLRAILRGAVASQAQASCPECPMGLDLSNAQFSIELFANTLLAGCEQVGQIVYNASNQVPGTVSSYEDLWRFNLANYHAGPGCLSYAIYTAWAQGGAPLTWERVSSNFTPACLGVVHYVEQIAK
ncbi:MAG: hypothetical protein EHM70_12500 [Chloroflexota bacterium]|nr:MAG: hypothetical protein EHM70_12500 [Chloroflexota bacterium]